MKNLLSIDHSSHAWYLQARNTFRLNLLNNEVHVHYI